MEFVQNVVLKEQNSTTSRGSTLTQRKNAQVIFYGDGPNLVELPNSKNVRFYATPVIVKKLPKSFEMQGFLITATSENMIHMDVAASFVEMLML